ncbi:thymidine phosphorylase [Spirochaetia bacterium]|nr:thymidine phosphorylase [Spirochaetia bacterium]GHU32282.1 thymidine phosphorylase [Spirochaetia bacterium]
MEAVDLIVKKRSGQALNPEELEFLIKSYVAGTIPDYQVAAWAMAVFFQGMSPEETAALTTIMIESGSVVDLSGIPGPFVDKHSTGGVGDKTSLILAPLVASLGIRDPMMSGRALGHTGGTLDKLESIPGYRTSLSVNEFRDLIAHDGFAMTGQTADLVPADRLLYKLRDVTGTVESIPLITASILSKKKAEGTDALVLDVKYGSGAFMQKIEDAEALARSLVSTGTALKMKICALLTDMDEPLGAMTGNFLEMEEAFDCLEGNGPEDLMDISLELAARMLMLAQKAENPAVGREMCEKVLATGKPRELFLQNIDHQGGDARRFLEMLRTFRSPVSETIHAEKSGFIARIDAGKVGRAGIALGIGRAVLEDEVYAAAGVQFHRKRGNPVQAGDPVMTVWARDESGLRSVLPLLKSAVEYSDAEPPSRVMVLKAISGLNFA